MIPAPWLESSTRTKGVSTTMISFSSTTTWSAAISELSEEIVEFSVAEGFENAEEEGSVPDAPSESD